MQNKPTFISLSEALSWIAFGMQDKKEELIKYLAKKNYSEDCKDKLNNALESLLSKARGELITLEGKEITSKTTVTNNALTIKISSTAFKDFAAFSITDDGLYYGNGLFWLPESIKVGKDYKFEYQQIEQHKHTTHYVDVDVNFSQLKKELKPGRQSLLALSDAELKKWWHSMSKKEKLFGYETHEKMLTEIFPHNHISQKRLREVRSKIQRKLGRPEIVKK
jgi:hypothetical protein